MSRSNPRGQRIFSVLVALAVATSSLAAQAPQAIGADPPRHSAHPARMEVLHIPSGGVRINGVAYLASGAGAHPTFVLLHGLPGNEKNLDLAQAVRRAGWNAITFNYRGSWGSPGTFRFGHTLEDADAVLRYLNDTSNVRKLGIDPRRIVIAGHSMGGWVAALTAAHHPELRAVVLISYGARADRSLVFGQTHRPRDGRARVARSRRAAIASPDAGGDSPDSRADTLTDSAWGVISGTEGVRDVLAAHLPAKEAGLFVDEAGIESCTMPIVPLCETIADLRRAAAVMRELFAVPVVKRSIRALGGVQEVMIGYSDSKQGWRVPDVQLGAI